MYRLTAREKIWLTAKERTMPDNYGRMTSDEAPETLKTFCFPPSSEIVDRDGKLFVLDPWESHFTKPIRYRTAWPTGLFAKDYPHFVGQKVKACAGGTFRFSDGLMLRLEHGGETKPDSNYFEERPIPKSPGCHEYRNGRWVR